jgi:hypothetical protein
MGEVDASRAGSPNAAEPESLNRQQLLLTAAAGAFARQRTRPSGRIAFLTGFPGKLDNQL